MTRSLIDYLALPYTRELIPEPEGGWFVRIKELPGCISQGETPEQALSMIEDAMHGWLEASMEAGDPIPEPRGEADYSGKFLLRMPRSLHQRLVEAAEANGVSLNQYIVTLLASALPKTTHTQQFVRIDRSLPIVREGDREYQTNPAGQTEAENQVWAALDELAAQISRHWPKGVSAQQATAENRNKLEPKDPE